MGRGVLRLGVLAVGCLSVSFASCTCEEQFRNALTGDDEPLERRFEDAGESSQPTEQEPNNAPEQATMIELGNERRPIEGSLASEEDVDWFAVRAVEGQRWLVTMEVEPLGNVDPRVELEVSSESDGGVAYDTSDRGEIESIRNLDVTDEVLRFAVRSSGGTGDYRLTFKKQLTGGAVEREPNDVREAATSFEFPGEVQGFYGRPGDRDWYHVVRDGVEPGIYRVSVTPTGEFSHRMKLYTRRKADSPYLSIQAPPDEPASVPNVEFSESIEGLWVSMQADDNYSKEAGYRVRAVRHPTESEATIEGEPNDSAEQAVGMRLGEMVRGYLHEPSDRDQFHVAVGRPPPDEIDEAEGAEVDEAEPPPDVGPVDEPRDAGGERGADAGATDGPAYVPPLERVDEKEQSDHVVQVGLRPLAETDRLALTHFADPHQGSRRRTRLVADGRGEPVKLCNVPIDEGLIRVGVRGERVEPRRVRDSFTYELTAVDVLREVDRLEIEPNDERARADRLPFDEPRTGFISQAGDEDVFAFGIPDERKLEAADRHSVEATGGTGADAGSSESARDVETGGESLPPAEPVSVEISLEANRLDLGFAVLDEQGALIAEVDHSGPGADESTSIDLPPGLYFVEVSSARDFECRPYEIEVTKN